MAAPALDSNDTNIYCVSVARWGVVDLRRTADNKYVAVDANGNPQQRFWYYGKGGSGSLGSTGVPGKDSEIGKARGYYILTDDDIRAYGYNLLRQSKNPYNTVNRMQDMRVDRNIRYDIHGKPVSEESGSRNLRRKEPTEAEENEATYGRGQETDEDEEALRLASMKNSSPSKAAKTRGVRFQKRAARNLKKYDPYTDIFERSKSLTKIPSPEELKSSEEVQSDWLKSLIANKEKFFQSLPEELKTSIHQFIQSAGENQALRATMEDFGKNAENFPIKLDPELLFQLERIGQRLGESHRANESSYIDDVSVDEDGSQSINMAILNDPSAFSFYDTTQTILPFAEMMSVITSNMSVTKLNTDSASLIKSQTSIYLQQVNQAIQDAVKNSWFHKMLSSTVFQILVSVVCAIIAVAAMVCTGGLLLILLAVVATVVIATIITVSVGAAQLTAQLDKIKEQLRAEFGSFVDELIGAIDDLKSDIIIAAVVALAVIVLQVILSVTAGAGAGAVSGFWETFFAALGAISSASSAGFSVGSTYSTIISAGMNVFTAEMNYLMTKNNSEMSKLQASSTLLKTIISKLQESIAKLMELSNELIDSQSDLMRIFSETTHAITRNFTA